MEESTNKQKCVFVVGATATGKSAWALEQAVRYDGTVINIDSIQCYSGLEVGSAAPTAEEKRQVPHFLYNYVQAPREITAADYLRDFYSLIEANSLKFPLFITGGTGFYIQALEKGMFDVVPIPVEFRKEIENELNSFGPEKLYKELLEKDPESKIHINDHFRLVRAIEILRFTGEIPSRLRSNDTENKYKFPFDYMKIGFDFEKSELEKRVKKRTEKMIAQGIVEEAEKILKQGHTDWAPLNSVGYRECLTLLNEKKDKLWLSENINKSTMKLIKKQKTWFKRDPAILWSNQQEKLEQFLS